MSWTLSELLSLLEVRGRSWCIVEIRSSGGFSVPPNNSVIYHTLLEGQARIATVSGGTMELRAGDVRVILSGETHAVRTHTDSEAQVLDFLRTDDHEIDSPPTFVIGKGPVAARLLCGRLKADWPSDLRRLAIPPFVGLDASVSDPVTPVRLKNLQVVSSGSGSAELLTRFAQVMLTTALRNHPACSKFVLQLSETRDPIAHAMQIISANPTTDWSVASLANKVGMGRSNFAARFTAQVGRAPMDVVTEQRMHYAANLLTQSELKIAEISERSGYSSEAAFSRRFTRFFGQPPGRMRRNARPSRSANLAAPTSGD